MESFHNNKNNNNGLFIPYTQKCFCIPMSKLQKLKLKIKSTDFMYKFARKEGSSFLIIIDTVQKELRTGFASLPHYQKPNGITF